MDFLDIKACVSHFSLKSLTGGVFSENIKQTFITGWVHNNSIFSADRGYALGLGAISLARPAGRPKFQY